MDIPRARDLMIPIESYPHISPDVTIAEAIARFLDRSNDIMTTDGRMSLPRALFVFGDDEELVGILRRRDILRGLRADFLRSGPVDRRQSLFSLRADPDLAELSYDHMLAPMKSRAAHRIADLVQPITVTVKEDDHLFKIIDEMVDANVSLIPVLSDGVVTGAVRSVDVLGKLSRLLQA